MSEKLEATGSDPEESNKKESEDKDKEESEKDEKQEGDGGDGGDDEGERRNTSEVAGDTSAQDVGDSNPDGQTEETERGGEEGTERGGEEGTERGGEEGTERGGEEGTERGGEDETAEKPEGAEETEVEGTQEVTEEAIEKLQGEEGAAKEEAIPKTDTEAGEESMSKEGEAGTQEDEEKDQSEKKEQQEGDEEEEEEEEEVEQFAGSNIAKSLSKKKLKTVIPEDFFYNYEELQCQPCVTEDSGIPLNMLQFSYSLGYDSTKRANLHLISHEIALLCTGSLVTILNLKTREQTYMKCTGSGGVGAITDEKSLRQKTSKSLERYREKVHPSKSYFAVGEKGLFPDLNIYEYPSLRLYRILRKGTERRYSFMNFSPDGCLLASQGGAPDYMLTLWDWRHEQITLRCKAFSTEVFRVTFSSELEGQLTTAGSGHIKFWKVADTYTGLKLQGHLGKFGKTKLSDIEGYVELPDGKVVSGCEWGNMLVWDGGLIKVQITRKNNKTCHVGHIQQILLDEGEMMTIGVDGYIRVWDFEMIDTADAVDDSGLFEMEPMNELRVGSSNVQLYALEKVADEVNDITTWYAQDACGGIWNLDLTFSHTSQIPSKQFSFNAGPIEGADCSPLAHMLATTGDDHTVRIFDYITKKQMCEMRFTHGGTSLIWLPEKIDRNGNKIIASFADGIVRLMELSKLSDEGASRKNKNTCNLNLYQVIKPHNKRITAMCLNHDYTILATGSVDCTIFFSAISNNETFDPIGFVMTDSHVLKLQWSPGTYENETIMAVCENGTIIEYEAPQNLNPESDQTFLLTTLKTKTYTFQSIKSVLRHEEELEIQRKLEEKRKKEEDRLRQIRRDRGLESESDEEQEEAENGEGKEEKKEDEWNPVYPENPSPVLCCLYSLETEGNFWLSMGDFDAGYLYECTFNPSKFPERAVSLYHQNNPVTAVPVLSSDNVPISVFKFSHEGAQLLLGFVNGKIRIHQLPTSYSLKELGPYWELGVHDSDYGHLTNLVVSYDKNVLLSAGADANIFVFIYMSQEEILEKINQARMMSPREKEKTTVDDIEDPKAYSIEDAKQKAEYDKMLARAHQKKEEVRIQIALLRRDFKHLLDQNELLPEYLRFSQKDFEIDSEIKVQLRRQMEEKVQEAEKKVAWISEKHSIGLEKIRSFYKDHIECERIVLHAFLSTHTVSSIRLAKLPDGFLETKLDLETTKYTSHYIKDSFHDAMKDAKKKSNVGEEGISAANISDGLSSCNLRGAAGERILKSLRKVEAKKKKRAQRKAQWDQLFRAKPADDYEDPKDVAAIKEAKENMGDYKLKTAEDYTVPDHLRMNVHRAKLHLYHLVQIIYDYSSKFNQKLIALREEKIEILEQIESLTEQIYDIQNIMNVANEKPIPDVPYLFPEEQPEKQFEYTSQELITFKKALMRKGGTLILGSENKDSQVLDYPKRGSVGSISFVRSLSTINIPFKAEQSAMQGTLVETAIADVENSPLQNVLEEEEEIRRQYNRDKLLEKIESLKKNFDAKLKLLRHEKFELDVFLKYAELRQVTGFEELVLLKEFEKHENVIAAKVVERVEEKIDMTRKIEECRIKIETKKKELERLQEREKSIHSTFFSSLGESNKFSDYLTKVFKKKIKRFKKKETEGSDEESDESSSDESDLSESDEESVSEMGMYDLDVCPSGCDQTLYDNTCQLREKRLDIEEENVEEKKNFETLKKDMEYLNKKAKVIQASLETAENDLEAFQLEKQRKLNELQVVASLLLRQIQHTVNHQFPPDVSKVLIFKDQQIINLHHRIKELQHEKTQQKKNKREENLKHIQLLKDQHQFEQTINELENTCDEMMTAKFGCIVDLEILETITSHRANAELRDKVHLLEDNLRILRDKKRSTISYLKKEMFTLTQENTNLLGQMRILLEEKDQIETALNTRQKNLGGEFQSESLHAADELDRLHQLCQLQAHDAMTLKQEILLLTRKGGHILPPIEPPTAQIHSTKA